MGLGGSSGCWPPICHNPKPGQSLGERIPKKTRASAGGRQTAPGERSKCLIQPFWGMCTFLETVCFKCILSVLSARHGARTHNSNIKSQLLFRLSQPSTPDVHVSLLVLVSVRLKRRPVTSRWNSSSECPKLGPPPGVSGVPSRWLAVACLFPAEKLPHSCFA